MTDSAQRFCFEKVTRCSSTKGQRYVEYISYFMRRTLKVGVIIPLSEKGDKKDTDNLIIG